MNSYFQRTAVLCLAMVFCAFSHSAPTSTVKPFVIAPMIEGMGYCPTGGKSQTIPTAMATCANENNPSASLIKAALNRLEPGGAAGSVQVGYTVGINLLGYTKPKDLLVHLLKLQKLIASVKRPVVLYLMGNQFAALPSQNNLPGTSYAVFADQSRPSEQYFSNEIIPWTLNSDATIDVNRIRFAALQAVGQWYVALHATLKAQIIGFSLAGELHHFYPDFANGLGRYDNPRVTDYSPTSVHSFQNWLRGRYLQVTELNKHLGSTFTNFEAITPPSIDLRQARLKTFTQHFDAYAHGVLPIEGWLANLPPDHKIRVFLDGHWVGDAEYGLSRQDVYEKIEEIKTAGVGFRYWLDFSALPRGVHTVQVALVGNGVSRALAKRKIVLMGNNQNTPPTIQGEVALVNASDSHDRFWLDQPRDMQDYYFNPLAKAWYEFRSEQVTQAYRRWFELAATGGLPKHKLYSHQIAVSTVGTWNPLLTASDASLSGIQPYKKGMNLYGGSLNVALLRRHYLSPGESFAVPEFHTQDWKNPNAPEKVITSFKDAGANFMTPYFISIFPAKFRIKGNQHDKFRIAPDNPAYGSSDLYRAIIDMARQ